MGCCQESKGGRADKGRGAGQARAYARRCTTGGPGQMLRTPCSRVMPSMPSTAKAEEHTSAAELDRPEPTPPPAVKQSHGVHSPTRGGGRLQQCGEEHAGGNATLRDSALNHEVEASRLWVQVRVVGCQGLKHALVCCLDIVRPRVVVDIDFLVWPNTLCFYSCQHAHV